MVVVGRSSSIVAWVLAPAMVLKIERQRKVAADCLSEIFVTKHYSDEKRPMCGENSIQCAGTPSSTINEHIE